MSTKHQEQVIPRAQTGGAEAWCTEESSTARAEAGLDPLTFTPLLPYMQRQLDAMNRSNSTGSKKRKLEDCAKNKQTVHNNPNLSATDKMSDGKHASICTCRTIPVRHIAV